MAWQFYRFHGGFQCSWKQIRFWWISSEWGFLLLVLLDLVLLLVFVLLLVPALVLDLPLLLLLLLLLLRSPVKSLGFTILGEVFAYVTVFLIRPLRKSHSVFLDGACWVCFCCRHSPV